MLLMAPSLLLLLFSGSAAQRSHQPRGYSHGSVTPIDPSVNESIPLHQLAAQIAHGPTKTTRPAPSPPSASAGPLLPPWPPTYDMQSSTILQPSNADGWLDEATEGQWGIVDIDWENSRRLWAGNLSRAPRPARPMCERNMITQVEKLKAARPNVKAWVYRNIVKADNWFESVQKVLDDPQYAGWFVRFNAARLANNSTTSPPCDSNYDPPKCSPFYHDQTLVPNVPDPHSKDPARRHPAGACVGACDCGKHPCGEYVFDHRNASLRKWLLDEYIGGKTGMGHPDVSGMFLDDQWDPVLGPSEFVCGGKKPCDPLQDMGLKPADVQEMATAWREQQVAVHHKIVGAGGFDWPLLNCESKPSVQQPCTMSSVAPWVAPWYPGRNASGPTVQQQCTAWLRKACTTAAPFAKLPLFFGLTRQAHHTLVNASGELPALMQDLATFLLVRGRYAWIGHGWTGNGNHYKGNWSPLFERDYGTPITDSCSENSTKPGVFHRSWTKAEVVMDCNAWMGHISVNLRQ